MAIVFQKPSTLTDAPMHYCPGCTHGIVHRLVAQAIEELGIEGMDKERLNRCMGTGETA